MELPEVRPLLEVAANVGHAGDWREWKDGLAARDADVAYLKAWLQDARSVLVVRRFAARLRQASILEAHERLNCRPFGDMFLAMLRT